MEDPLKTVTSDPADKEHERTYMKFVKFTRAAALALPFFVAFVLYWTQ
jgi:hypothetical protein